jgi:hypothetical protein
MAVRNRSHTVIGGEVQLLAGIWALVCVAVLTTAAFA